MSTIFDRPLLSLGKEASTIKKSLWGEKVFYIKNYHINFTNICALNCRFCAFAKSKADKRGYILSIEEIINNVRENASDSNELHIVGALHPEADIGYYIDILKSLKKEFPDKCLKSFGAVEMEYIATKEGITVEKALKKLIDAGLGMMPGGGAEIFAPRVRNILCPEKISGDRWLEIMEIAHQNGIKTNATMLYGHIETYQEREEHLLKIRKLQDKTGGFNAFIPLNFHPYDTPFAHIKQTTAVDDLRVVAASRIILDNVPHIKAYWVMTGDKTAQTALHFGADDLDGTIVKENITYAAGKKSERGMTEETLIELIRSAGFKPVQRDSFYGEI